MLREVIDRLRHSHEFDYLGNLPDPLDELIYIVLSARTRGDVFQRTYKELRQHFPTWEQAYRARLTSLEKVLQPAGLSHKKASWLKATLKLIRDQEGAMSLERLGDLTDSEAEEYLTDLPGVGIKTARCVLMYSLGRRVFPVDANVRRVLERLEVIPSGVHYNHIHEIAQDAVPPDIRADLHIYSIIHGRTICIPRTPRCSTCPLNDICPYPHRQEL